MNETILKFAYPATLVREYEHWVVLLRPQQPTLGSLVLAAKSAAEAFSGLDPAAFAELAQAVGDIETALRTAVRYDKINYLMLMMADPQVHFHVIPRYAGERSACGVTISDTGWPKTPALAEAVTLDPDEVASMVHWLKAAWR